MERLVDRIIVIETDEGRTFFLIDIPCHPEFLKEEELVTILSQAWMQAMDEVQKNSSTDTPERVLTLCINLVSTLYQPLSQPTRKAIDLWEKNNANLSVLNVLQILLIPISMKDLVERAEQTNRTRFVNNYVKPLLELELIKMKYPDNPHHQNQ